MTSMECKFYLCNEKKLSTRHQRLVESFFSLQHNPQSSHHHLKSNDRQHRQKNEPQRLIAYPREQMRPNKCTQQNTQRYGSGNQWGNITS